MNLPLVALLIALTLPGLLLTIPRLLNTLLARAPVEGRMPPRPLLLALATLQTLLFVVAAAVGGALLAPRVGLDAPVLRALLAGDELLPLLASRALPVLFAGSGGALVFLAAYYLLVRPNLDPESLHIIESMRLDLGAAGRMLYGGVVEEIIARWGLMTFFVWLTTLVTGDTTLPLAPAVVWFGIVAAGLLFGLLHAPGSLAAGARPTPTFWAATIGLNLWASLIFGWLFWQYGLLAAIAAHALFHLLWLPLDWRFAARPRRQALGT